MIRSFPMITRMVATAAALLLLVGCAAPSETIPPVEPHEPCHEPFTPTLTSALTVNGDSPDQVPERIEAIFNGLEPTPADHFTYEDTDGGIRLISYQGEDSRIILPDEIEGKSVVALGDGLFRDNTALSLLAIPESVTDIGTDLLTGCRSLQLLRTPQLGATRADGGHLSYFFGQSSPIGTGFRVPSTLDTVILLDTITCLADNAFLECDRVKWVLLPDTLTEIGSYAFAGCSSLTYAPLPTSLQTVGDRAFEGTSLQEVVLPTAIEHVGASAFADCDRLWHITLPFLGESRENVSHLGYLFGAESYNWNSTYLPRRLTQVTLTEGDIPDYAFYRCETIETVVLPSDCTIVGVRAFWGCSALQAIILPDSIHTISDLAFAHCTTLCSVSLPSHLTSLGLSAFMDCTNLTDITLPDTLQSLPNSTFADCCNLRTITLGEGLRDIGVNAFHRCASLTSVTGGSTELYVAAGNEPLTQIYP